MAEPIPQTEKTINPVVELYTGTTEQSFYKSSYWMASQYAPYNPDDLFQKTSDYSIHEEMLNDDQVDVCVQIKKDLIIGSGSDITCDETSPENEEIQRDLRIALYEDPDQPFDEMLEGIISAYSYGFSLSEKLFKYRDTGHLTLKNIKTRHPSSWEIHTDDHGNILKHIQHGPHGDIELDTKALIHLVNNKYRTFGGPYGSSDLRSAYNAYFVKRQIIKWYAIFLEKAASPTPIAQYDKNAPQTAVNEIFNAIKSFQSKTAMVIPKEIEIEFLESKSNGEAYIKGINIFNMFIGRALLIPDLLGFQGSETSGGSYSLGKDQLAIFFKHILRRRNTLEHVINKEIIYPLVVHNYGMVDKYPKFRFNPIDDTHLVELAKLWSEVSKGKIYNPSDEEINHFRSLVQFPQGEVDRNVAIPAPSFTMEEKIAHENEIPNKDSGPDANRVGSPAQDADKILDDKNEENGEEKEKQKEVKKTLAKKLPGSYDKKTDYAAIKSSMERFAVNILKETEPIVKRIFEDLYDQIKAKKILQNQDIEKIESLKLKSPKDINLILKRGLRDGYKEGQILGRSELLKGSNFRAPLAPEDFLEFLDNETFQYIGDWTYEIKKKTAVKLREAIRDGKPMSAVLDELDTTVFPEGMVSVERYSRTKFTDVMNQGRLKSFEDSGVVAAYQYSAILDDRTSEICDGLHGKVFKAGTEPVPPMHFNCRSLLVPVTKYEEWEADNKSNTGQEIISFIEDFKGKGFSTK